MGRKLSWHGEAREKGTTIFVRNSIYHGLEKLKERLKKEGMIMQGVQWDELIEFLVDTYNNVPEYQCHREGFRLKHTLTWGQIVTDVLNALQMRKNDFEPMRVDEIAKKTGYTWQQVRTAFTLSQQADHNVRFSGKKPRPLMVAYIGKDGMYALKKGETMKEASRRILTER